MHVGKIKKIVRDRGFGFISNADGGEIFFHRNDLVDIKFETLRWDQQVESEVEKSYKGPKAFNIRIPQ